MAQVRGQVKQMAMMTYGLRAVYAVAIAAVLIAALRPGVGGSEPVQIAASPLPVAQPSPSPQQVEFYDPQLAAAVEQVKSMPLRSLTDWAAFCTQTNDATGYTAGDQYICRAMRQRP